MKKLLEAWTNITSEILNYFDENLIIYGCISNNTEDCWYVSGDDLYFGDEPPILEDDYFDGFYRAEVGKVYEGNEFTMVIAHHGCGGDPEMMVFDNLKKGYTQV